MSELDHEWAADARARHVADVTAACAREVDAWRQRALAAETRATAAEAENRKLWGAVGRLQRAVGTLAHARDAAYQVTQEGVTSSVLDADVGQPFGEDIRLADTLLGDVVGLAPAGEE